MTTPPRDGDTLAHERAVPQRKTIVRRVFIGSAAALLGVNGLAQAQEEQPMPEGEATPIPLEPTAEPSVEPPAVPTPAPTPTAVPQAAPTVLGAWTNGSELVRTRAGFAAIQVNGLIFAGGGVNEAGNNFPYFEELDPQYGLWIERADIPLPLDHFAMAEAYGRIFVAGGSTNARQPDSALSNAAFTYEPAVGEWLGMRSVPVRRWGAAMASIRNVLYLVGGRGDDPRATYIFDPLVPENWPQRAPLNAERERHALVAIGARLYAIGGSWQGRAVPTVEMYDADTNTWTLRAPMPVPRSGHASAVVNGRIHVFGGDETPVGQPERVSAAHDVYDPARDTWEVAPALPAPRSDLAAVEAGGRLYVVGGRDSTGQATRLNQVFALR